MLNSIALKLLRRRQFNICVDFSNQYGMCVIRIRLGTARVQNKLFKNDLLAIL